MATMYHLFFSIFFIALCSTVYVKNYTVDGRLKSQSSLWHEGKIRTKQSNDIKNVDWFASTWILEDVQTRSKIIRIAADEIGVREATGNNDGARVEDYLGYTGLGKGYAWCAAFVSWCYGQAGLPEPRNPWSPALFPNTRTYCRGDACRRPTLIKTVEAADVFGIYGQQDKRINHVGLVKNIQGNYLITIEGNSNNRVESKRRHLSTIYALANWIGGRE